MMISIFGKQTGSGSTPVRWILVIGQENGKPCLELWRSSHSGCTMVFREENILRSRALILVHEWMLPADVERYGKHWPWSAQVLSIGGPGPVARRRRYKLDDEREWWE